MNTTYENIVSLLTKHEIHYLESRHEPVYNSKDVMSKLNTDINSESKSVAVQVKGNTCVVTIPISEKISVSMIKQIDDESEKIKLVDPSKIKELLGVSIGALAPFGYSDNIQCYLSAEFLDKQRFYFNPGKNDVTFQITSADIRKLASIGILGILN